MIIDKIKDKKEILNTSTYFLSDLGWSNEIIPKTSVNIGFLENFGLYFYFKVQEKNPRSIFKNHLDPVYKDSAVEAFLQFKENGPYLNIEVNGNRACLAELGENRLSRKKLSLDQIESLEIRNNLYKDYWTLDFIISEALIKDLGLELQKYIFLNLYKICEGKSSHYGSLFTIESDKPDFHKPEFFGKFQIKKRGMII